MNLTLISKTYLVEKHTDVSRYENCKTGFVVSFCGSSKYC